MATRVPIPVAAHRALNELLAEIDDGFEPEQVYDVDDLLLAFQVMSELGNEDACIAHKWMEGHRAEYLRGLVEGFEPV